MMSSQSNWKIILKFSKEQILDWLLRIHDLIYNELNFNILYMIYVILQLTKYVFHI